METTVWEARVIMEGALETMEGALVIMEGALETMEGASETTGHKAKKQPTRVCLIQPGAFWNFKNLESQLIWNKDLAEVCHNTPQNG